MRTATRFASLVPSLSALGLLLAACGGGGGPGGGGVAGTALLKGAVIQRDGSTSNLAGIVLTFPRTGQVAVTDANGAFTIGTVPAGTLALRVTDPAHPAVVARAAMVTAAEDGGSGGDVSGDPADDANDDQGNDATNSDPNDDGDNHDTGDDDMDVTGVADGETVSVRLSVRDGIIESVSVSMSGHDDREAEVRLTRAATSDDPDIAGEAETQNRTDRQRLKVHVEHADSGRSLEAFVVAPDATEASLGTVVADASGEAKWDVDTSKGDTLPLGATTVADLTGDSVEVRDASAGTVLLTGTLADEPPEAGHDGEEHHSAEGLTAAAGVTGEAKVEAVHRTDQNRDKFRVEVDGRTSGETLDVWLEDPANLGTLTKIGSISTGGEGEGSLEFDTHDGDTLPYGVASVSALVGLRVEIRNASNAVLFSGVVPALVAD